MGVGCEWSWCKQFPGRAVLAQMPPGGANRKPHFAQSAAANTLPRKITVHFAQAGLWASAFPRALTPCHGAVQYLLGNAVAVHTAQVPQPPKLVTGNQNLYGGTQPSSHP